MQEAGTASCRVHSLFGAHVGSLLCAVPGIRQGEERVRGEEEEGGERGGEGVRG